MENVKNVKYLKPVYGFLTYILYSPVELTHEKYYILTHLLVWPFNVSNLF